MSVAQCLQPSNVKRGVGIFALDVGKNNYSSGRLLKITLHASKSHLSMRKIKGYTWECCEI